MITNGFTYIAFLIFLAGMLLFLEKKTKAKIFNIVPPLVWIYVLNMVFCTMGLYNSEACANTYSALKNNILYAMIFVMLLRCDFKKLSKLGGRMVAIFLGCSLTLAIGFLLRRSMLPGSAVPRTWRPCRRRFRSMPVRTAARLRWIPFATRSGLRSSCLR